MTDPKCLREKAKEKNKTGFSENERRNGDIESLFMYVQYWDITFHKFDYLQWIFTEKKCINVLFYIVFNMAWTEYFYHLLH